MIGNFLIGSPLEDLSWLCVKSWRFGKNRKRVAGLGNLDDLIKGYESNSSIKIDLNELDTWQIYGSLRWGVICMIQTFYHLNNDLNSLEKAAIGRRVSETEFDLMNMIKNKKVLKVFFDRPSKEELMEVLHYYFLNEIDYKNLQEISTFKLRIALNIFKIIKEKLEMKKN